MSFLPPLIPLSYYNGYNGHYDQYTGQIMSDLTYP